LKSRISKKASDSLFILVPVWFNRLKAIIFLPVIVAVIGLESHGVYVLIIANIEVLTPFAHLAMGQALVRYTSAYSNDEKQQICKGFWTPVATAALLSLLLCLVYALTVPLIDQYFIDGDHRESIYASIPLIAANAIAMIIFPYFNSRKRFKVASIYRVLRDLVPYLGLIGGIVYTGELYAGILLMVLLQGLLLSYLLIIIGLETGAPVFDIHVLKRFLKYSWPLAITIFSQRNIESIPKYMISLYLGSAVLGLYNIMFTMIRLVIGFNIPFLKYTESHLPKLWDEAQRDRASSIIATCTRYYFKILCRRRERTRLSRIV